MNRLTGKLFPRVIDGKKVTMPQAIVMCGGVTAHCIRTVLARDSTLATSAAIVEAIRRYRSEPLPAYHPRNHSRRWNSRIKKGASQQIVDCPQRDQF